MPGSHSTGAVGSWSTANGWSVIPSCGPAMLGPGRWPGSTGGSPTTRGCPSRMTRLLRPRPCLNSPRRWSPGLKLTCRIGRCAGRNLLFGPSSGHGGREPRSVRGQGAGRCRGDDRRGRCRGTMKEWGEASCRERSDPSDPIRPDRRWEPDRAAGRRMGRIIRQPWDSWLPAGRVPGGRGGVGVVESALSRAGGRGIMGEAGMRGRAIHRSVSSAGRTAGRAVSAGDAPRCPHGRTSMASSRGGPGRTAGPGRARRRQSAARGVAGMTEGVDS